MRFLKEFDDEGDDVRFTIDVGDVQIVKAWATMAKQYYGIPTAMMGLIVLAHFKVSGLGV